MGRLLATLSRPRQKTQKVRTQCYWTTEGTSVAGLVRDDMALPPLASLMDYRLLGSGVALGEE